MYTNVYILYLSFVRNLVIVLTLVINQTAWEKKVSNNTKLMKVIPIAVGKSTFFPQT